MRLELLDLAMTASTDKEYLIEHRMVACGGVRVLPPCWGSPGGRWGRR